MTDCNCEPHASGSNRCAYCKAEATYAELHADADAELESAVELLKHIATISERTHHVLSVRRMADDWLAEHGYESGEALRERAARTARAEQLDAEIERLRAERAKL